MKAKRLVYSELCNDLKRPDITILLGARQVDKTFLLKELERFLQKTGKKTAYYNLEIPADLLKFKGSKEDVFRTLTRTAEVILLDEFHYLKMPRTFSKRFSTAVRKLKSLPPAPHRLKSTST